MWKLIFAVVFTLALVVLGYAQSLPSNFHLERETGPKTGFPVVLLTPSAESIAFDAMRGNVFEALGGITEPDLDIYQLTFVNAKKTYQLSTGADKSCTVTADEAKYNYPRFKVIQKAPLGKLLLETVQFKVKKEEFEKVLKAKDVLIRCGKVVYDLDQDNIDALHYMAAVIEQAMAERKK